MKVTIKLNFEETQSFVTILQASLSMHEQESPVYKLIASVLAGLLIRLSKFTILRPTGNKMIRIALTLPEAYACYIQLPRIWMESDSYNNLVRNNILMAIGAIVK